MKKLNLFTTTETAAFNPMVNYTFEGVTGSKPLNEVISDLKVHEMNKRHIPYRVLLSLQFNEVFKYKAVDMALVYIDGNYELKLSKLEDWNSVIERIGFTRNNQRSALAVRLNLFTSMEGDEDAKFDILSREYTHKGISTAMFESLIFEGEYNYLHSDEIEIYKSIIWGKRAPSKFWSTMTDEAFANIIKYHALFIANIDTLDKAKRLNMADLVDFKVPYAARADRGFKLFTMASLLYPNLKPWQMHFLPKSSSSEALRLAIAASVIEQYDVDKIKMADMKRLAPCMYRQFGSVKKFKAFVAEMGLK